MAERIKSMMEIQSEGYPTNACERAEQEKRDAYYAQRLKAGIAADIRRGLKVCRACRGSRSAYVSPARGCPHRREADRLAGRRSRSG